MLRISRFVCLFALSFAWILLMPSTKAAEGDVRLPLTVRPFELGARDLEAWTIGPFPLEGRVEAILQYPAPDGWAPTGADRSLYLDLAEPIVRMAAGWVDEHGAVIDPIIGKEWAQTSGRFASSAAVLIRYGRCRDLLEPVCRVMARCCRRLASGDANDSSPDFWMRELITADLCLDGLAPAEAQAAWREDLRRVEPEKTYRFVDPGHGKKLWEFHNWAVYSSGGEALRDLAGLTPPEKPFLCGKEFFDIYMRPQLSHMTAYGMYRDPGDPITYDVTTRLQIAVPLAFGLESDLREPYVELLRRGGLTGLLFVSPEGYLPYGGRSSQFHFQEAMFAALCELEARRHAATDPRLAGAFKRQAHRSAQAIRRWIVEMDPIRHIKNGYAPATSHGIDRYGQYSVYSLLASSFLGLATLFADDAIAEAPTPAEIGGYAVSLRGAFNKVFASTPELYIEIDTAADLKHDATGLGRILFTGAPMEMVLPMPFSSDPHYRLAEGEPVSGVMTAFGPAWQVGEREVILAGLSSSLSSEIDVQEESPGRVRLAVRYACGETQAKVEEQYDLQGATLRYAARVAVSDAPVAQTVCRIPVIETDGDAVSEATLEPGRMTLRYRGSGWTAAWDSARVRAAWEDGRLTNRNGRYRVLRLTCDGPDVAVALRRGAE